MSYMTATKNMKKLISLIIIAFLSTTLIVEAKGGGGGGGHSSGGGRSSSSFSSSRTGARSITGPAAATTKISTPTISTRPSLTTQTKTIPTTTKVGSKTYSKTANVVGKDYQPRFNGGYVPPIGSTVQYRESSMLDWLPFYLIMTMDHGHREAIVTTPASTSTPATTKVVKEEGTDTMYIMNIIISILFCIGLIWLVMYLVNRRFPTKSVSSSMTRHT